MEMIPTPTEATPLYPPQFPFYETPVSNNGYMYLSFKTEEQICEIIRVEFQKFYKEQIIPFDEVNETTEFPPPPRLMRNYNIQPQYYLFLSEMKDKMSSDITFKLLNFYDDVHLQLRKFLLLAILKYGDKDYHILIALVFNVDDDFLRTESTQIINEVDFIPKKSAMKL